MTHEHEFAEEFENVPDSALPALHSVSIGRDLLFARRDLHVHNVVSGQTMLRQHAVVRGDLLNRNLFVPPGQVVHEAPLERPPLMQGSFGAGAIALLGRAFSGRRTAALNLLDTVLADDQKIFELFPDWDHPDVTRIPSDPGTGYLLNLRGVLEPLGSQFHNQLDAYARRAHETGTFLVITATSHVWNRSGDGPNSPVRVITTGVPSALKIAHRRLSSDHKHPERAEWLSKPSGMFSDLLCDDAPPADAVRLAEIVLEANGPDHAEARDRFLGWENQINAWFGHADPEAPEKRALQISAAFFDGCSARTVIEAADALLAEPTLNWPTPRGGPLAGADSSERCLLADLHFAGDGTVSISKLRPGIDRALLQHLWHKRPPLVPVLTNWISAITRPGGLAADCLERLSQILLAVAESEGPGTVIALAHDWLRTGKARHSDLAIDLLDRLAIHPILGPAARKELGVWAKAHTWPERQRAVAAVCKGRLGTEYTSIALTRLRYVLDRARDPQVKDVATAALQELLVDPELSAPVLTSLVEWTGSHEADGLGRPPFLDVFATPEVDPLRSPAALLLSLDAANGETVRHLLRDGWRGIWRRRDLRAEASAVLGRWCDAASEGILPADAVEDVVAAVFTEEADALGDDLDRIIGGNSSFRTRLRARFVDVVRETAVRRTSGDTDCAA
ncbi:hypothetical protein [Streptomyces sp. NPDC048157]|uniref:hypothetical protein n=1 Tax=Streptomyces sp. NPDC048157 TaxID=3365503 RepID=UPI00371B6875